VDACGKKSRRISKMDTLLKNIATRHFKDSSQKSFVADFAPAKMDILIA